MFGFVYEDSDIEKSMIEKFLINKNKSEQTNGLNGLNGLMIMSGGCTMFDVSKYFANSPDSELACVDFNPKQLELVENKIKFLQDSITNDDFSIYNEYIMKILMPFDNLFLRIKNGDTFEEVFDNLNLTQNFGSNAVSNTNSSFVEHFKQVYESKSVYHEWIWNRDLKTKFVSKENKYDLDAISKVKLIVGNFIEYLEPNKYDFIQTSNLTDWMNEIEFDNFCLIVKKALKPNGILIMRRLLSNNILETKFPTSIKLNDKTNFYKETICFVNKIN